MDEMKFDMCGRATVMGVLHAVNNLKPKIFQRFHKQILEKINGKSYSVQMHEFKKDPSSGTLFVFINKVSCSAARSFKGEEMYAVEKRKA